MAQDLKAAALKIAEGIFESLHEQLGADEIETNNDGQPLVTIVGDFDTDTDALDLETLDVEFGENGNGTHWPLSRWATVEALADELEEAFGIHEECERNNAEAEAEEEARREAIEA